MKGISKYIDDMTKKLSMDLIGKEYRGIMSTKLRKNKFLVKEDKSKIHFNESLCRNFINDKEEIHAVIREAVQGLGST